MRMKGTDAHGVVHYVDSYGPVPTFAPWCLTSRKKVPVKHISDTLTRSTKSRQLVVTCLTCIWWHFHARS